jgi:hypothetical protein
MQRVTRDIANRCVYIHQGIVRWRSYQEARTLAEGGSGNLIIHFGTTTALAENLRRTGADVTIVEEAKGHESPGEATILKFRDGLKVVLE